LRRSVGWKRSSLRRQAYHIPSDEEEKTV